MILEVLSAGPIETNTYLIGCKKTHRAALIDAPFACADWVKERLEKHSLRLDKILLTHSHWDHMGEAALLKEMFHVKIYVHREDAPNLESPGADQLPLFVPVDGVVPDGYLEEGQVVSIGELHAQVIHTPGHSPGCVCFYFKNENALFSGDTLFCGTMGKLSFPTSRPDLMPESLKKLAALPQETRVYPGHGESTTIGQEKWIARAKF